MKVEFTGNKPFRGSEQAAGFDLAASSEVEIKAGEKVMVGTGTSIALPDGVFALATPRSSICNKKGLRLVNGVGIIDSDYRGEIKFCYENTSDTDCTLENGERIGQIIVLPYIAPDYVEVESLTGTERGTGGFGSTGAK